MAKLKITPEKEYTITQVSVGDVIVSYDSNENTYFVAGRDGGPDILIANSDLEAECFIEALRALIDQ